MAIMPTEREAEQKRIMEENDRRIRNLLKQQFTERWARSSETERAEMVFDALQEKADRDHPHPREKF